ncbi:MAG: 1,4-alpha-glucan branching protein GlgB [Gammaproteobacteria bacterium]|jgi:1,4-alpha-glucan branching enzyme|nr:1,4-alpha-glucan branching protein GlgB [Gammaproteobacteria bacterium]MDH3864372.1 1,4-alpha-glucan branching protein GlgB [Gammaproteobacteria bacterium]MDH3906580.1 1,4-alpha-glucan branching protein GlgB [Gammaproteobacteria bacterium]MDH3908359.1 1,4-alpha-glucan branching protein GlgB [Gammaproteobacteria bacterium]MDH3953308.1 1,4-alpha-glucan branching protein GlgB [Gammaproteobacteria bacterium]
MNTIATDTANNKDDYAALAGGHHGDPFSVLGVHQAGGSRIIRTLQPHAERVEIIDSQGTLLAETARVHPDGIFAAVMPPRLRHYRLRLTTTVGDTLEIEDPYRFPTTLGDLDLYLFGEGSDKQIYAKLGAQLRTVSGISGTRFAVWAPNASRVSVIGDFNDWDGRRHAMRLHPANGLWEIFIPGVGSGEKYKFELLDHKGHLLPLKNDPFGHYHEPPPGNASIVFASKYQWSDYPWMQRRTAGPELDRPISIYEVHLGSWRRRTEGGDRYLSYRELADELVDYVSDMGFTHMELLPVSEHPFDGSWGYQPIGMYAPTQRFGNPDDFRYFVDRCHAAGIGVIVDWVPAHFPRDEHGLRRFDGTAIYEHEDPRKGEHADWGTLIFNFGRREVINYLIGSALYWIDEFHVDALRVDAVASMLYLDYSREDGEWVPNEFGGNENLEAVAFLKRLNTELHAHGATTYAEESTAWPGVSRPVDQGGLGFTFKWNMGWMNDTLSYMGEDPVHRKHHHDKMTFGLVYAFNENFVLPLSHDEVVHGKRSLLGRMPGDEWQRFANLRAYLTSMYAHPGKKLLFMGSELAPYDEWSHDRSLDWHLLDYAPHRGVQSLVRDLNALYRSTPALYEIDFTDAGFEWIDWGDRDNSVLSWLRRDASGNFVICVSNMTPVVRHDFRMGVPGGGRYRELLTTDDVRYGGSGVLNGDLEASNTGMHGREFSIAMSLPALATIIVGPVS